MLELLVSLLCYSLILLLMVQSIRALLELYTPPVSYEFDVAIKQVQTQIATTNKLYVLDGQYCFDYNDSYRCLMINHQRMYLKPGTQIVLTQYESIQFYVEQGALYVTAKKNEITYYAKIYDISE